MSGPEVVERERFLTFKDRSYGCRVSSLDQKIT